MLRAQQSLDDKKLIKSLADGNEMAFEVLFYRYRGKIGNFLKRSLPPSLDIEVIVDEIFLRVWNNKSKIDTERPFEPYLFQIAKNIVIDELRKYVSLIDYLHEGQLKSDLSYNNIEREIEEIELIKWLENALGQLPPKRKEIFMMHRFEDLTYSEIAQKLNISENTVDTQIRRSLQFFRKEFEKFKFLILLFL